jgi:hypothetical protein
MAPIPKGFPHPKDACISKADIIFNYDPKNSAIKITNTGTIPKGAKGTVDTVTGDTAKVTVQSQGDTLKIEIKVLTFIQFFTNLTSKD